jgi:hypothetical protein
MPNEPKSQQPVPRETPEAEREHRHEEGLGGERSKERAPERRTEEAAARQR